MKNPLSLLDSWASCLKKSRFRSPNHESQARTSSPKPPSASNPDSSTSGTAEETSFASARASTNNSPPHRPPPSARASSRTPGATHMLMAEERKRRQDRGRDLPICSPHIDGDHATLERRIVDKSSGRKGAHGNRHPTSVVLSHATATHLKPRSRTPPNPASDHGGHELHRQDQTLLHRPALTRPSRSEDVID